MKTRQYGTHPYIPNRREALDVSLFKLRKRIEAMKVTALEMASNPACAEVDHGKCNPLSKDFLRGMPIEITTTSNKLIREIRREMAGQRRKERRRKKVFPPLLQDQQSQLDAIVEEWEKDDEITKRIKAAAELFDIAPVYGPLSKER